MKEKITIVVPCYNEKEALAIFIKEINKLTNSMKNIDFELLFVDDGSEDSTIDIIKDFAKNDKRIKYISFSRNFGKEAAMFAGFEHSTGDYVVCIDADLQHPPQLIKKMYEIIKNEGYDCVAAHSIKRQNYSFLRKILTKSFYKIINKISNVEMKQNATDFRLMKRNMVNGILKTSERIRYLKGIFGYVGFKTKWIDYVDNERIAGKTKWNLKKLLKYASDGIISFSPVLPQSILKLGILLFMLTIIYLVIWMSACIIKVSIHNLILLSIFINLLLSSVIMCSLGIIGMYISQIHVEVKNRPHYLVREDNLE